MVFKSQLTPDDDRLLDRIRDRLLPIDAWGSFHPGARAAAVTLILYRRHGELRAPFVLKRADLRRHAGQVGLPGGILNPAEEAWLAAAREAEEEISISAANLIPLGAVAPIHGWVMNYSIVTFVAWLNSPPQTFVPQPEELQAVLEVPVAHLLDSAAWRAHALWPGTQLPIGETSIWGLTAYIVRLVIPSISEALNQ
jgi:8-oxo-dGTP pyrophosphatase MutT (NUDIX family)